MIVKTRNMMMEVKGIGIDGRFLVGMLEEGKRETLAVFNNEKEAKETYDSISDTLANYYAGKGELVIKVNE